MRETVICEPRAHAGRALRRRVRDVTAADLGVTVDHARCWSAPGSTRGAVDEVILGQCYPNGEAPGDRPGRRAGRRAAGRGARRADRPALRLGAAGGDLRCHAGADRRGDVVLAGGVESMSKVEFYSTGMRWGGARGAGACCTTGWPAAGSPPAARTTRCPGGMLETAENLRREYGIAREEQDELALRSTGARWPRRTRACSPRRSSR